MRVGRTNTAAGVYQATLRPAERTRQTGSASAPRSIDDAAEVMGIPSEELTPKVRDAIMTLMREVETLRQELDRNRQRIEQLEDMADKDPLVPVLNRRAFVRDLTRELAFTDRYGTPSSLLFFDINNMKRINDRFGHAAGDEALKRVSSLLSEHIRASDHLGRLGGDEFAVILVQAGAEEAETKARELAHQIASHPLDCAGEAVTVELSYGVHTFDGKLDADQALAAADQAMYDHKRRSKNDEDDA